MSKSEPIRRAAWFILAASLFVLGPMGVSNARPQGSLAAIVLSAERGNPQAQTRLGFLHEQGIGVPQNYHLAAMWYHRAAEQGDPRAQHLLGILLNKGFGVHTNFIEILQVAQSRRRPRADGRSWLLHPDARRRRFQIDPVGDCGGATAGELLAAGVRTLVGAGSILPPVGWIRRNAGFCFICGSQAVRLPVLRRGAWYEGGGDGRIGNHEVAAGGGRREGGSGCCRQNAWRATIRNGKRRRARCGQVENQSFLILLQCRRPSFNGAEHPPIVILTRPQADYILGRLIHEHGDGFILAAHGADQRKPWTLLRRRCHGFRQLARRAGDSRRRHASGWQENRPLPSCR